ncbi:MAG: ribonuclease III [Patescibacteria group bacterium]|nr:ribonuclease III [Patescibacteria group bacterium]
MEDLKKIQKKIGVDFNNLDLLKTAFIHRSYINEHKSVKEHNERLEFLGDAVLELVTTEFLYENYDNPEGDLTNWRSALVKTESISAVASELGFEDHLRMSRGERASTGRSRQLILANSFEAIIGAIYLDRGYKAAQKFIKENLLIKLDKIIEERLYVDAKSHFQELAQEKEGITPRYEVVSEDGPDHDKTFVIAVKVGDKIWGKGKGSSKQAAQQEAAKKAVKKYE